MKKVLSVLLTVVLILAVVPMGLFSITASAATSGYYSYIVTGGGAIITDCDTSISGDVIIPDTLGGYPVTRIAYGAFKDCTSLTSITIPDSVVNIGDSAFECCTSLTSIILPDSIKSIGDYVFYECYSLESITIPDGVKSIGDEAFYYCSSLTSIILPDGVTEIGYGAFSDCESLKSITIPEGVTSIGERVFAYCYNLVSITIPNSVTSIGDSTFYYCYNLVSITIPNSVTSIGDYAFYACYDLESIILPKSVTSIGESAFGDCDALEFVYYRGSEETQANISIGLYNDYLTDATWQYNSTFNTQIGVSGFYTYTVSNGEATITACDTSISGDVTIPDKLCGYPVTSIGDYAFYECYDLTGIIIPDSVTSIGEGAFSDCYNLENITIPDGVTSIGNYTFAWCYDLESMIIPDGVITIGDYAFYDCNDLSGITIPDSVTSIGEYAFESCYELEVVCYSGSEENKANISIASNNDYLTDATWYYNSYSSFETSGFYTYTVSNGEATIIGCDVSISGELIIPDTLGRYPVTSIGDWVFAEYYNLESVIIPDGVKSIGNYAFYDCDDLISITIPNSVISVGDYAFAYCYYLTNITIPNSVISIGNYAFSECYNLKSIILPKSVTSIGDSAFEYSDVDVVYYSGSEDDKANISIGLYNSVLTDGAVWYYDSSVQSSGYYTYVVADGEATIIGCDTAISGNVTIPATFGDYSVTGIANSAFSNCDGLTSIILPEGVTSIGDFAFYDCDNLTSINVPEGVEEIGYATFESCHSLKSVSLPESLKTIGVYAFYDCYSLEAITIPEGVTYIDEAAFGCCYSLKSVNIPAGVTSIEYYTFADCYSLTSIIIPDGVEYISYGAFTDCYSLASVTIPAGVIDIYGSAFADCDELTSVYYRGSRADKEVVYIGLDNSALTNATWHYISCYGTDEHTYSDSTDVECDVCEGIRILGNVNLRVNFLVRDKLGYSFYPTGDGLAEADKVELEVEYNYYAQGADATETYARASKTIAYDFTEGGVQEYTEIAAYEMMLGTTFVLRCYVGEEVVYEKSATVTFADLVERALVSASDKSVYVDILNYGAAAQDYFASQNQESDLAEDTDKLGLPNADIADYQQYATSDDVASADNASKDANTSTSNGARLGATLQILSSNRLVFIVDAGEYDVANLKLVIGEAEVDVAELEFNGGYYYYYPTEEEAIALYDAKKVLSAELYNGEASVATKTYSIEAFAAANMRDNGKLEALGDALLKLSASTRVILGLD